MPTATAQQIEAAVEAAIERKDYDAAIRVAGGHPDESKCAEFVMRANLLRREPAPAWSEDDPEPFDEPEPFAMFARQMFALANFPAKLVSFNPRAEIHGNETQPAADLKFETNVASEVLDAFDPALRRFLYHKADEAGDLANQAHDAPNLRIPKLSSPLKWSAKFAGYQLRLHIGLDERSHVVIGACDLNNVQFSPQEGGTVLLHFRIQCHPGEAHSGKLAMLVQSRIDISLTPPEDGGEVDDDPEAS